MGLAGRYGYGTRQGYGTSWEAGVTRCTVLAGTQGLPGYGTSWDAGVRD